MNPDKEAFKLLADGSCLNCEFLKCGMVITKKNGKKLFKPEILCRKNGFINENMSFCESWELRGKDTSV
jgi:hypothetical protein